MHPFAATSPNRPYTSSKEDGSSSMTHYRHALTGVVEQLRPKSGPCVLARRTAAVGVKQVPPIVLVPRGVTPTPRGVAPRGVAPIVLGECAPMPAMKL